MIFSGKYPNTKTFISIYFNTLYLFILNKNLNSHIVIISLQYFLSLKAIFFTIHEIFRVSPFCLRAFKLSVHLFDIFKFKFNYIIWLTKPKKRYHIQNYIYMSCFFPQLLSSTNAHSHFIYYNLYHNNFLFIFICLKLFL